MRANLAPATRPTSNLGVAMNAPTFSARAALHFCLLFGLISGCAHAGGTSTAENDGAAPETESGRPGVTSKEIERSPTEPVEKHLMARFPGVWVTTNPDGTIGIRIRGTTTVHGHQEPLYVIDGIPVEPGPNGSLSGINPRDIASIQVLKNAIDTALYGTRGANGVILIKLKSASE